MTMALKYKTNENHYQGNVYISMSAILSSLLMLFINNYLNLVPTLLLVSGIKILDMYKQKQIQPIYYTMFNIASILLPWLLMGLVSMTYLTQVALVGMSLTLMGNLKFLKSCFKKLVTYVKSRFPKLFTTVDDIQRHHPRPLRLLSEIVGVLSTHVIIIILYTYYVADVIKSFNNNFTNCRKGDFISYQLLKSSMILVLGLKSMMYILTRASEYGYGYIINRWSFTYKAHIINKFTDMKNNVYLNINKVRQDGKLTANIIGDVVFNKIDEFIRILVSFVSVLPEISGPIIFGIKLASISMMSLYISLSIGLLQLVPYYFGGVEKIKKLDNSSTTKKQNLTQKFNEFLQSSYYLFVNNEILLPKLRNYFNGGIEDLLSISLKKLRWSLLIRLPSLIYENQLYIYIMFLLPSILSGSIDSATILTIYYFGLEISGVFNLMLNLSNHWSRLSVAQGQLSPILNKTCENSNFLSPRQIITPDDNTVCELNQLKLYKNENELVIDDGHLKVLSGQRIFFKAKNGRGKSMFFRLLSGAINQKSKVSKMYIKPSLSCEGNIHTTQHIISVTQQGDDRYNFPDIDTVDDLINKIVMSNSNKNRSWTDCYKEIYKWVSKSEKNGGLEVKVNQSAEKLSGGETAKCDMIKVLCRIYDLKEQNCNILILLDEVSGPLVEVAVKNFRVYLLRFLKEHNLTDKVALIEISHEQITSNNNFFTHQLSITPDKKLELKVFERGYKKPLIKFNDDMGIKPGQSVPEEVIQSWKAECG
jgi:ABC-type transport system involved in cytochrome bd biosynthesis fused ATPase/permease subunit